MGKFGKKVVVDTDISNYMIGIMGPSGYGKSTLMYNVCDKKFGDDGYLLLDMGSENGTKAIDGVMAETVPTWKKMKEVVDDITKNKASDYPNLKVVILDTIDATFEIAEQYVVKVFNQEHMAEQGFRPAASINSVEGGFGRGLDRVIATVKKEIKRLNDVGVGVWWTSHVKERDQTDLFTGTAYTQLTASMSMKYFNSIKDISHVIGFGYYNRKIEKQEVDNENPVTKKKKTRESVISEDRMIKFRDDSLVADAKSRFADIIDEIPLDSDMFVKAIEDAISAASNGNKKAKTLPKKKAAVEVEPDSDEDETLIDHVTITEEEAEELKDAGVVLLNDDDPPFDVDDEDDIFEEEEFDEEAVKATIRTLHRKADADVKAKVKEKLGSTKLADMHDEDILKEVLSILE